MEKEQWQLIGLTALAVVTVVLWALCFAKVHGAL